MEKLFNAFVRRVDRERLGVEGIAALCEGRPLFEHRWIPDRARNIYSNTKSFTATAAGMAIAEGRLSLHDRLAECFPEAMPENASPLLYQIELRHLLTMSSGFNDALLMGDARRTGTGMPDYVRYMLSQPVQCEPGGHFCYSTADSILAGRMIEEKVGMNLSQYLYERLFRPLQIGCPIWENCPLGHPVGGGGLFLTLRNMMKLGQLYLDHGQWHGEQILAPSWVSAATSRQIDTPDDGQADIWRCGYGYQFWLSPYPRAYRADGAYGQITAVLPEAGMVVGIHCPEVEGNFEKVKTALHEEVLSQL